uniref:Uncharacterized protein n=1 Tax=Aegilops tauschii subsp. strangulata TaxID=200361 RepID=A0A453JMP0_AEGTS
MYRIYSCIQSIIFYPILTEGEKCLFFCRRALRCPVVFAPAVANDKVLSGVPFSFLPLLALAIVQLLKICVQYN